MTVLGLFSGKKRDREISNLDHLKYMTLMQKEQERRRRDPKDLVISEEGVFGNQDTPAKGSLHGGIIATADNALKFDFNRKKPFLVKYHEINLLSFAGSPVEDTSYVAETFKNPFFEFPD